jgi:hypothetical protein
LVDGTDGQGVDLKLEQHLVAQLDAHARHFLSVVNSDQRLQGFKQVLTSTGSVLLEYTQAEGYLSDQFGYERLVEFVENKRAKHISAYGHQELQAGAATENIGSEPKPEAISWHQRKREILFRIEMKFESRYLHWEALAIKQMLAQPPKEQNAAETTTGEPVMARSKSRPSADQTFAVRRDRIMEEYAKKLEALPA